MRKVAATLAGEGGVTDVKLLVAALMHDTVEDTETTLDEITEPFGDFVRDVVAEISDDKSLPNGQRKHLQIENAGRKSDRV